MKSITIKSMMLIFFASVFTLLFGQQTSIDLTTPLAVDPNVKIGKLDNGMVYYIRQNHKPEKRVELRLVVNAGSVLENNDQQGLAHFMEHMNFNGTKTFPKNELIDFLQKTGVRFGADINAYTSFDETVYMVQIPTDDSALVEKGYQVIEDWAHNALLDDKEIDKERGVIVEEWRLGLGAEDRMMKKYLPVILKDSRYAERLPIGKVDIIENFKHEVLKSFYHDWYRPDLQAVIIVGDIDPAKVEARIKAHFSGIQNPGSEKPRTNYDLPDNKEPLIAINTDKEATGNNLLLFYKHPLKIEKTLGDYREALVAQLFTGMLNQRFNEISQKPESPYVYAGAQYGRFLARSKDAYILYAGPKESQIENALRTLLAENERVKQFGFTQTELDRQKEEMLSNYEKAAKEWDKTESLNLTDDYVQNYLSGDPIPGAQKEFKYVKTLIPDIKLEEINNLARTWITDEDMALSITAPEKENVKVPSIAQVEEIIKASKTNELKAYVDNFREEPLVSGDLKSGKILDKKENKVIGYTELTLSNGIKVALKSTAFKNDEIQFSGYSLGGYSYYPDPQFLSAHYAATIMDQSGAGHFDNIELQKKLKGKNLTINPYISDVKQGFTGNSTPKDMETLMQLVYLYITEPRKDTTQFKAFISQIENQVKFMKSNPLMTFFDTLYKCAYPNYQRMVIIPNVAQLEQIKLDDSYRIYKDRFADAGGFKFFMVGNFQIDSISPLIERYFGSLPSLNRNEKWVDKHPHFAPGITNTTIYKGADPQSMVGLVFSEPIEWNPKVLLELNMLKEIIDIKLIEVIREKLSGVYSPMVFLSTDHYPVTEYMLGIVFGCSPKNTDKLSKAVLNEIKKIRKHGPTDVDLKKAQETLIRARETDLEKNTFWLGKLESVYYDNTDPANILNFKERVNAITIEDLKNAANIYYTGDHYVRVVLKPEKK
ncbi:MAG: insulinase family protein [Bacteroidetes bacterium]|nr:insulinase family protein [Bacteroidota bacterium]